MKKFFFVAYPTSLIIFTFFSYSFVDTNFIYFSSSFKGFSGQHRILVSGIYLLLISIFFGAYIFLIKNYNLIFSNLSKLKKVVPFFLVPVLAYPAVLSYDLFNYIATAKVLFYYHDNPYLIMPIEFLHDPILSFTRAANKLNLYGIFWTIISGIPYSLSFGNYIISILMFKVFISLFYLGLIVLIWKLTKNKLSVVLFAANPLVVIETFVSGHNDVTMMFFALLSIYFLKNKKVLFTILFLVASIFIKYATLFLIPVFIFAIIRNFKNGRIDWSKVYFVSFILMFMIFLLSFLREEIYPWYAIWPITFLVLIPQRNKLINIFLGLSFGPMLSYIPYMYFGTYFGPTPITKIILMLFPVIIVFLYQAIKTKEKSIL